MDAVTYPHDDVQAALAERVVPIKLKIDEHGELAQRMGAIWTPGLLWLTPKGDVTHSNVGYFEPEEFQAELAFGCGKTAAMLGDWKGAEKTFDEVAQRWPGTHATPAALYWTGVAGYKATKDAGALKKAWTRLLDEHAGTAWAMKASFLRS